MAEEEEEEEESFEAFHVPQQSRRDKLRVTTALLNPLNPNNTTANHHHHQVHVDEEEEGDIGGGTLGDQHHFHQHHHHGVGVGRGGVVLHDPSSLLLTTTYTNTSNPLPILGSGSGSITIGGGPDKHQHPHLDVVMSSVKEEGSAAGNGNLMMNYVNGLFMNNSTATATASHHHHHHHPLFTSPNNTHQQPTPTRRVSNPFDLYNLNNFTDFNGGAGAADVVAFRPQPLSFIINNHNDTSRTTTTISGQGNLSLSLSSTTTTTFDLPYTSSLPLSLPPPLQLNTTIDHPHGTLGGGGEGGVIIIDDTNTGGGASASASTSRDVRSLVPLGPFTGYASILKGSKFLKPAKQLLDEFCYVGVGMGKGIGSIVTPPNSNMDPPLDTINGSSFVDDSLLSCTGPGLSGNSRLISMLDEVYRRYKLYYQQMQAVVASFESVAGLGNAAPYTSFALKAMSRHFSYLKNAITDQLHSNKAVDDGIHGKNEAQRVGTDDQWVHGHRPAHNLSYFEHQHQPVWRPQRGLPERAVAVLRAWLFEHFLHPYPTDTDKQMLAKQTGLSRSQVSNWFINARVRLWKPMVEEIHMLETCQAHKTSDVGNRNSCNPPPTSNPPNYDKQPQTSSVNVQDQTLKRTRDELHDSIPERASEPTNFMYNKFLNHHHIGAGVSTSGGNSGVSLTLGLRQNNGIGLSESFPMNIAHQFGLEASNDGYVIGSFEVPPRHFGRDEGGQLFHDFVG